VIEPSSHDRPLLCAVDSRGIATLVFNRPEKRNSYNQVMIKALFEEMVRLGTDPSVRALVLRGTGQHFSAGADVSERHDPADMERMRMLALCTGLDSMPKPLIALVQGACIGGAVALISCCDMVIAAQTAFFSLPEVRLGFAPGPLIPFFLRGMSARNLRRYLLSGERFTAVEALRIGLVHELCDTDAGDAALAKLIGEVLLAGPNAAVQAKELLHRLTDVPITKELLAELQFEFNQRLEAPEAVEGRAAFREKRKPKWHPI
jgi:methylglutaconyl-CoA hydratase